MKHRTDTIRKLNDHLRINIRGGMFMSTQGVQDLEFLDFMAVLRKMKEFDAFTEDNDPWGEHDFGAFDHKGVKYFWKIDYYDNSMQAMSPDPADPDVTRRVITLMTAAEY